MVLFDVERGGGGWKSLVVDEVRGDDGGLERMSSFRGQLGFGVFGGARKFLMIYDQFSYESYHEAKFESDDSRVAGEDHQGLRVLYLKLSDFGSNPSQRTIIARRLDFSDYINIPEAGLEFKNLPVAERRLISIISKTIFSDYTFYQFNLPVFEHPGPQPSGKVSFITQELYCDSTFLEKYFRMAYATELHPKIGVE